jgi:hypothetical protein
MRSLLRSVVILSVVLAGSTTPDAGAESFSASLSASKPSFGWSGRGAGGPGFECSNEAEFRCDTVLFTVDVRGDLNIAIDVEGDQITNPSGAMPYPNLDLYLFAADSGGAKQGEAIAEAATPIDDEKLTAPALAPGSYLLEVRSSLSIGEDYTGKARLTNFAAPAAPAPVAAPPAQVAQPAPAAPVAKSKSSARAKCRAKARKIKSRSKRARALKRCARAKR